MLFLIYAGSELDHLKTPDDLSFKVSNIMHILKFSHEQWHEFGLIIGFSLQDIADCQSSQSLLCTYQSALLERWLSTDNTASWYALVTAIKSMLPPAYDCANHIAQKYPIVAETTERELKEIENIMLSVITTTHFSQNDYALEAEEMDVDRVISDVTRALDERYKAIEEVLHASKEQLSKNSNSQEYWKRQEQLDKDVINALSNQNDLLDKWGKLCDDISFQNNTLDELLSRIQNERKYIDNMYQGVHSKKLTLDELQKQLSRLKMLRSKNAERLTALLSIPPMVSDLQNQANKNHELWESEKRKLIITIGKNKKTFDKLLQQLSDETQIKKVTEGMNKMLDIWTDYFSTKIALGATIGAAALLAAAALSMVSGFGAFTLPLLAAAGVSGTAAAAAGAYTWLEYKKDGRKHKDLIAEKSEMATKKRKVISEKWADMLNRFEPHTVSGF